MIRIECACKICKNNNHGKKLAARVPAALHAKLKGKFHGTVYSAHDPSIVGVAVRAATGIEAA